MHVPYPHWPLDGHIKQGKDELKPHQNMVQLNVKRELHLTPQWSLKYNNNFREYDAICSNRIKFSQ
jgi:hypothetical protein